MHVPRQNGSVSAGVSARARYVVEQSAACVIEAPAGFGKTAVLREIASQRTNSVIVADHESLAALTNAQRSAEHLLVDMEDPDVALLERLASASQTLSVTVASRFVPSDVRALLSDFGALELGPGSLRCSSSEVHDLFAEAGDGGGLAEWVFTQTDGWPLPITCVLRALRAGGPPARLALSQSAPELSSFPAVDDLLRELAGRWPEDVAAAVRRFGTLGRVTVGAFEDVAGRGSMAHAVRAGVPFAVQADGWVSLNPLMRRHLGSESDSEAARLIAPSLARTGGTLAAAKVLTTASAFDAAADLLLAAESDHLDGTDPHQLLALVDVVAPNCPGRVELELLRARAIETQGDLAAVVRALERAAHALPADSAVRVDVELELKRIKVLRGDTVPPETALSSSKPARRTRQREINGLRDALSQEPPRVSGSIDVLRACAAEWEQLGYAGRAASILRVLGAMPLTHLGRYADAIDAVHRARQLSWNRLFDRAICSVLLVLLGGLSARHDLVEREMNAARSLSGVVDLPWLDLYLAVASAQVEAFRGSSENAQSHARRASESLGGLLDHPTAVTVNAQLACTLAVAGNEVAATQHLALAQDHRQRNEAEVAIAEVVVWSRAGGVAMAREALTVVESNSFVPPDRLWRPRLEVGLAMDDKDLIRDARHAAVSLRLDHLVETLSSGAARRNASIRALGPLRVQHPDGEEEFVEGRPADLLIHLLSSGGSVPIDTLVEAMWPNTLDIARGRQRLRNPLSRLRAILGAEAVQRTDNAIVLSQGVRTDVAEFERLAQRAKHAPQPEAADLAVDALAMYQPYLSDRADLGEGNHRRTALAVLAGDLLDLLLSTPPTDAPSSSWLLATALRLDPDAESRLVEIAARARHENNVTCTAAAVRAALHAADRLDVPISPRLEALRTATTVS